MNHDVPQRGKIPTGQGLGRFSFKSLLRPISSKDHEDVVLTFSRQEQYVIVTSAKTLCTGSGCEPATTQQQQQE